MAVSKETAAALAAKYPHLAAQAADAEPLEVLEQYADVGGQRKIVSRHQKFKVGGQIVSLRAPEAAAPAPAPAAAPKVETPPAEQAVSPSEAETPVPVAHEAPAKHETKHDGGRHRK